MICNEAWLGTPAANWLIDTVVVISSVPILFFCKFRYNQIEIAVVVVFTFGIAVVAIEIVVVVAIAP